MADVLFSPPASLESWNGIALIGEAPGAEEERQGRPFVGRSGKLLDSSLAAIGIVRNNTLVANVFRTRPPDNQVGHFFVSPRRAAAEGIAISLEHGKHVGRYVKSCFACDISDLARLLSRWQPTVIVTLGATALWAASGASSLSEAIITPPQCRLLGVTAEVRACWHPSFVLRGGNTRIAEWREQLRNATNC